MSIQAVNILRYIAIGQAMTIFLMTVATIFRYAFKAVVVPRIDRALPIHVVLVGLSYLIFVGIETSDRVARLGEEATWRLWWSIPALMLGNGALIFMLAHLSVHRLLVKAILERAKRDADSALVKTADRAEARMERMEELNQRTADAVTQGNDSLAATETRRIDAIPEGDRTEKEMRHNEATRGIEK